MTTVIEKARLFYIGEISFEGIKCSSFFMNSGRNEWNLTAERQAEDGRRLVAGVGFFDVGQDYLRTYL